jgi:hypothetical protein
MGFGLSYCKPCKIAVVGGGVQQWAGYLKCSLYELVERYPAETEALAGPRRLKLARKVFQTTGGVLR